MESLQIAQILADLSSLSAAEHEAAKALVNAKRDLPPKREPPTSAPAQQQQPHPHPPAEAGAGLLAPPKRPVDLVRSESSEGRPRTVSPAPSNPGTPRREVEEEDVDKAATIMALYEIRAKLRHHDSGNVALIRAREKIAALAEKQQLQDQQPADAKSAAGAEGGRKSATPEQK